MVDVAIQARTYKDLKTNIQDMAYNLVVTSFYDANLVSNMDPVSNYPLIRKVKGNLIEGTV